MMTKKARMRVDEKACAECGEVKSVSEFYKIPYSGNPERYCKVCKNRLSKQYRSLHKTEVGELSEQRVITSLQKVGIYAVTGKSSEFSRTDIVAWGCVRIELKSSNENKDGYYHFGFTPKQRDGGLQADLIIIDTNDDYPIAIFPASHPLFYKPSGTLKQAFAWKPRMRHTKSPIGTVVLNDTLMRQFTNQWGLIEVARQQRIKEMLTTGKIKIEEPKVRSPQMELGI